MAKFTLLKKTNVKDISDTTVIPESDYSFLTNEGEFFQFKFHEDDNIYPKYDVKPGIWKIVKTSAGPVLEPTSFTNDKILEEFVSTKLIEDAVDCFFNNLDLYKEFGIEVPKRGALIYGVPGSGKTAGLSKVIRKYTNDNKTIVIVWHTGTTEPGVVKDFIQSFNYIGVERVILIAEDLGGVENPNNRVASDSSLLSLLDNQEKTFTVPVFIAATTNFPENFAANLTDRDGRFDDVIEVGAPTAEARIALLKFFSKDQAPQEALDLIGSKKCDEFVPSRIRAVYQDSKLKGKSIVQVITDKLEHSAKYKKAFSKTKGVGF